MFLDPVGDGAAYFELELNPLNAVLDLVCRRNRSGYLKDFGWECEGLNTEARIYPGIWVGEWSVPFAALGPDVPVAGAVWRANFCRIDRPAGRERELSAWSPTFSGTFHAPHRFGVMEFVEG